MALDYPDVLDHYDRSKAFGDPRDFKTFASDMETLHPGEGFGQAAQRDGWWTRLSTRLDQNVFQPVARETTGPLGEEVGGMVGAPEAGRRVGMGLPRALVETAPLYLAGPEAGIPATAAALGATGALMGAHTYAETGSPKAAVISGVTGAALPGVGKIGGGILPRMLSLGERVPAATLESTIPEGLSRTFPGGVLPSEGASQAAFKAARFAGSQAAMIGLNQASMYAEDKTLGRSYDPTSPDFWLQQIPFTVFDAVHGFGGKVPTAQEVRGQIVQPKKTVSQYTPPEVSQPEADATIEATMANLRVAYVDPNSTPEQKAGALAAANALIQDPKGVTAAAKVVKTPEVPTDVTGYAKQYSNGNWKVLQLDEQGNEKTVWVNGVEPVRNYDGTMTFKANASQVSPNVATPLTRMDFGIDPNQPELPPQKNPMGLFPWEEPEYKAALQPDEQRTLTKNGVIQQDLSQLPGAELVRLGVIQKDQPLKFTAESGQTAIVTKEPAPGITDYKGQTAQPWRVTYFEQDGEPSGHETFKTWEEAYGNVGNKYSGHQAFKPDLEGAKKYQTIGLKTVAQSLEASQQTATEARAKATVVPQTAEDIPATFGIPTVEAISKAKLLVGETELRTRAAKELTSLNEQFAGKLGMDENDKLAYSLEVTARQVLQEHVKGLLTKALDNGATPKQAVEKTRLATQTPVVDAVEQQTNASRETAKVISLTGEGQKPQATYADYVRDDNGKNFKNKVDAITYQDAHPELADHVIRNAGKGKGFYLGRQINKEVSLEGTNLDKILPQNDPSPLESRPDVSFEDGLEQLNRASQNPLVFAKSTDFDSVADAILALRQAKVVFPLLKEGKTFEEIQAALADAKVSGFTSPRNAVAVIDAVREGLGNFTDRTRNWTLDSERPFDQKTVADLGVLHPDAPTGIRNGLQWFINQKDSGVLGDIVAAALKAHGTDGIKLSFDPREGTGFNERDRRINLAHLPAEGEALQFATTLVHEYMHDVTVNSFYDNAPSSVAFKATLVEGLNALKNSPSIPKNVRGALSKVSDWYKEYTQPGGDPFKFYQKWTDTVGKWQDDWLHVVYALASEKELIPGMFNSPRLVQLMQETKMPTKPVTVMQYISAAWNKFFGGKVESDNVLSHILSGLDNYLSGDRMPPRDVSETSKLTPQYNGRDYLRDSLISSGVRPEALASRISTVEDVFSKGSLQPSIDGFTREMGAGLLPTTTEAGPLKPELTTALTLGEPSTVRDLTKLLVANDVPVHEDLYARMKEDVEMAVNLYTNIRKGLIPGELPPNAKESLLQAQVRLDAMSQGLRRQRIDIGRFNDLSNLTAEGMQQSWIASLSSDRLPSPPDPTEMQRPAQEALGLVDARREVSREALEQGKVGTALNWIRKNFMFMQYMKELIPATKPIIDNLFKLQGTTNFWKNELDAVYELDPNTKEFDKVQRDANLRVATNPTLQRAASDIKLWNQTEEAAGRQPGLGDSFVQNILTRFNKPDRDAIVSEANNARAVHDHWTEVTTPRYLAQKNQATVAKVIALREQGMQPDAARDLAGQFSSALDQMKDPQTAPQGLEVLNAMRSKMQPETFLSAFQLMKGLQDDSTAHMDFMRSRPNYVTEQRLDGKHAIRMVTPDNKPYLQTFGSRDDALAKVQELEKRGYKYLEYIPSQDLNVPYRGISEDFIGKLRELDLQSQNRIAQALQGVDPTIVNSILPELGRSADYEASLAAFSPVPGAGFPKRHFAAGREELNMVQQQNMFYGRAVNWMRHQLTRGETELDMLHPDMLADRAATKMMRDKVTEFLTPDSPLARKMSEFTYNWKLAGNFGVNALHLVQSLNTGMASLISETGGVGDALELTIKTQKAISDRVFNGKWASPEHDWLVKRGGAEGVLGNVTWDGDIGDSKRNALQYATTPLWNKPIEALKYAARSWNGAFFKFNDAVGLISAFDLGRSRGMDYEEAYNFARDVKNRGYFTGGKAQRSGFWSAFGPQAKAVPQLMSSLQTYVQGWFSLLAYNYTKGFGNAPQGMNAAQVLAGKKAFLYQLGAQAVLAGALGLPGVGQGMALVKQSTGVDVMSWLRQHLGELFDEDQKAGGMMTTLALHGLPAAASEAGIPSVDLSGRHMPSVPYIGVTPYKGFDVANLAGAPISSAADLVKGLMAATKGDVGGMSSLLPEVLKGPLRLWQGEGDVRDKQGNLITKLSPYERAITAMGLKPPRVTALQDVATAVKEANTRASQEKSSIVDAIATTYRKNGVEQGHQALIQYLQAHPDEDGKTLVREVSRRVVNQTTVPDWSQRANVAADLSGLGGEATSQAQRYSQVQDIQSSLGLHQRPSRGQQALYDQIDLLRQSDPYLSVAEAAQLVKSRQPRRRSIGLTPEAFQ